MKKINIKNKKVLIISIIVIVVVILGCFFTKLYLSDNKITTNMQFKYLGLNEYYEDDSNELTVNEAGKVLTSIYEKIYDISEIIDTSDGLGLGWQNYAYDKKLISNEEYLDKLTYIRLYELIYNYQKKFNNIDKVNHNNLNVQFENLTEFQSEAINYLYDNKIILNSDIKAEKFKENVNKNYFEDIIVKCILKFNLLNLVDDTINYEKSLKVSKDSNYFFITKEFDENILNVKMLNNPNGIIYLEPKDTYKYIRNDLSKITEMINTYFDIILNINYENISIKNIYNDLKQYALIDYADLEEYVDFVKQNHIQLEGNSKIIYPMIYRIDEYYYVRTMIKYNIISSNTNDNILFSNISKNTKYIDVEISKNVLGWYINTIDMQNLQLK